MSGTFTAGVLADGQLPNTQTTIYTAAGIAYLARLMLCNTNAAEQTVDLWVNATGTARKIRRLVLAQHESADVLGGGPALHLSSGDLLVAQTTTAAAVDYVLTGVVET